MGDRPESQGAADSVWSGRGAGWLLALLPALLTLGLAGQVGAVASGEVWRWGLDWVPGFAVRFSLRLDGLGLLMALLVTSIGALVFVYAEGYLAGHRRLARFYAVLMLFMLSMLGVVLADNLITLYLFWELTSLTSFLLIGFDYERPESRSAALQALLVTVAGGLALLAAAILLAMAGGSLELSQLLERGEQVRASPLYLPILLLVGVAAFTKSAQFPFHFWLPRAMEAPTPVSAYLHSATMVKAGVYLLARLLPVLGGTAAWEWLLGLTGLVTMLVGAVLAVRSVDLKQMLAYSTVSALGLLVLLLGLGSTAAVQAAIVFLVAHALYKGAMFMVAGAVDHETGTRRVDELGGLWRKMPLTAAAAVLAALSLAGIGPLLSFIGKELLLESSLETRGAAVLVPTLVVAEAVFVAVALQAGFKVFFGPLRPTPRPPHSTPVSLWLGPMLLALAGLAGGVLPGAFATWLSTPAVQGVFAGRTPDPGALGLVLWHGVNVPLALSVTSVVLGALVFGWQERLRGLNGRVQVVLAHGPAWWYDVTWKAIIGLAEAQTRLLQNGYLRNYLLTILASGGVLVGAGLLGGALPRWEIAWHDAFAYEVALAVLLATAAIAATRARSRLAAIAFLGVVGYGMALVFILFGAPDLAMTQFMIETLTVILFVLVLGRLPRFASYSTRRSRFRDMVVAGGVGVAVTALVLLTTSTTAPPTVSDYLARMSVPEAQGRNVVNVILVDFRSLDTLGEIAVLSVAAVGVFSLLRFRAEKEQPWTR